MAARTDDRIDDRWQVSPRSADGSPGRPGPRLGRIRLTPTRVTLAIALGGTAVFLAYALTVRDASQIPMLSTGAFVLAIVFSALAVSGLVATYRASRDGSSGRSVAYALMGGLAAIIAFGCFGAAAILAMVWVA